MIKGEISAKELAKDQPETYFNDETIKNLKKNELNLIREGEKDFFEDMNKKTNKGC